MSAYGPRVPTPHEFAVLVINSMRRSGETRPIRYERERFQLVVGEHFSPDIQPLAALYDEFCVTPEWRRPEILSRNSFSSLRFLKPPASVLKTSS